MKLQHRALAILVILASGVPALAEPALDQSLVGTSTFISGGVTAYFAQTFTVGKAGVLTGFDLRLMAVQSTTSGTYEVDLRNITSQGLPTLDPTPPLASIVLNLADLPKPSNQFAYTGVTHFDIVSANVVVAPGEMFAITTHMITGNGSNSDLIAGSNAGYSGGAAYFGFGSSWSTQAGDFIFQTYVDAAIPEPASLLLLAPLSFALLTRRRPTR